MKYPLIIVIVLALARADSRAGEKKESPKSRNRLANVIVIAHRSDNELKFEAVDVVEKKTPMTATPLDALESEPGIDLTRTGLFTPRSKQFKLRGLDSEKTAVTLNGRPLNGTGVRGGYQVDWSLLQLQGMESIEVFRGGLSAEFGNTIGGVVNLVPIKPEAGFDGELVLGGGEFETYMSNFLLSGRGDAWGYTLGGGYMESDGYLRNAFAERWDVSPALFYFFPNNTGRLRIGLRHSEGEYGMPIENHAGDPNYDPDYPESDGTILIGPGFRMVPGQAVGDGSYYEKARTELDIDLLRKFEEYTFEGRLYGNYEDRTDYFKATDGNPFLQRNCPSDSSWGWALKLGRTFAETHKVKVGVEGQYLGYEGTTNEYYDMAYLTSAPQDTGDEHNISKLNSMFIQDRWSVSSTFDVYLGARIDDWKAMAVGNGEDTHDANASPKLGMFYKATDDLELMASCAKAAKFPIVPMVYWYYNGYQPANRKDLTYDDAMQYEIGVKQKLGKTGSVSLRAYHYEIKNYLRWIFGYAPSRVVYNLDMVRLTGIEFAIRSQLLIDGLSAFANYTWEKTRKSGDILDHSNISDELGEIPEHKANLGLEYRFANGGHASIAARWVDEREVPIDAAHSTITGKMDSFTTVNINAEYPLGRKDLFLQVGVNNVFDEEYEEDYGYQMPERHWFFGVRYAF